MEQFLKQHPTAETLPPILPLVLYHGTRRWQVAPTFQDLIAPLNEALAPYVPQFRYALYDLSRYPPEALRGPVLTRCTVSGFEPHRSSVVTSRACRLFGIGRSLTAPPSHTTGRTDHVSGGSAALPHRNTGRSLGIRAKAITIEQSAKVSRLVTASYLRAHGADLIFGATRHATKPLPHWQPSLFLNLVVAAGPNLGDTFLRTHFALLKDKLTRFDRELLAKTGEGIDAMLRIILRAVEIVRFW